jgi:hypothetical protein
MPSCVASAVFARRSARTSGQAARSRARRRTERRRQIDLPCRVSRAGSDLTSPFQQVAGFQHGKPVSLRPSLPPWLAWK